MATLPSQFRADDHEELESFEPLKPGNYHVKIKDSSLARNGKDTGDLLKFTFEVQDSDYKGRLLFDNLNITHVNPTAQEIGEKKLAAICRAVGKLSIEDTEELHGCELEVKVTVKPATANYAAGNEVKNYSAIEGLAQPTTKVSATESKPKPARKVSFDE